MIDDRCIDDLNKTELGIFNSIIKERDRQKELHPHDVMNPPSVWAGILMKQLGQAAEQVITDDIDVLRLERELIQIAAVSVAWMEVLAKVKHSWIE